MGYWNGMMGYSTQFVSDYATDETQEVSDAFTYTTEYVSERVSEMADENIKWGQECLFDMIQTASLTHNLMESMRQSREAMAEEQERLDKYGDPAKEIEEKQKEEEIKRKQEEKDRAYYPKALQKYV